MDSNFAVSAFANQSWLRWFSFFVLLLPGGALAQTAQNEYALAMSFYERGEYVASISAFGSVIRRYPNSVQGSVSNLYLGESLAYESEYELAFEAFSTFVDEMPGHDLVARGRFRMGETAYHLGRTGLAIRLLEEFALVYPEDSLNSIALPYLGELRLKNQELRLAEKVFAKALRAYPDGQLAEQCRFGLAESLRLQGRDDEALKAYGRILSDDDQSLVAKAEYQIGLLALTAGEYGEARQHLAASLNVRSAQRDRDVHYWIARSWMQEAEFGRALENYRVALDDDFPVDSDSGLSREVEIAAFREGAHCATMVEEWSTAESWLLTLERKYPRHPEAADALAARCELAYRNERQVRFRPLATEFLAKFSSHVEATRIEEMLGRLEYEEKQFGRAVFHFSRLFSDPPRVGVSDEKLATWGYLLALAYIGSGEFEDALALLDLLSEQVLSPKMVGDISICRASTLVAMGDRKSAVVAYRKFLSMVESGPEAIRARMELCDVCADLKDWGAARAVFLELTEQEQIEDAGSLERLAKRLGDGAYQQEDYTLAIEYYEFLLNGDHDGATIAVSLSGLGWAHLKRDGAAAGQAFFARIIREYPESDEVSEALMARGLFLLDSGELEASEQTFSVVVEEHSDSEHFGTALLHRAQVLQTLGGNTNLRKSRDSLTDYIHQSADSTDLDQAIYRLAWVYHDMNLPRRSHDKFRQIISDFPNSDRWPDAAYRMAKLYVNAGEAEEAQALIERILKSEAPPAVVARAIYLQGQLAGDAGEWKRVTEAMQTLISRSKDESLVSKSRYWLAESLYRANLFVEAKTEWESLSQHPGATSRELLPWIELRLAQCLVQLGQWPQALTIVNSGLMVFPEFGSLAEFHFIRGRAFCQQGLLDEARMAFEVVALANSNRDNVTAAMAQWRIGETFFHQEQFENAIKAYEKVAVNYSCPRWRAAAMIQAGKCQEQLGNWQQSAKLYGQLVLEHPESEFAEAAKARLAVASRYAKHETKPELSR